MSKCCLAAVIAVGLLNSVVSAQGVTPEQINDAINKGVEHIKKLHFAGDLDLKDWKGQTHGKNSLLAWALLEAGVPANDPDIQDVVRGLRQNPGAVYTYSLAVPIIFLDRLGNPADSLLIQSFAVRLLEGQCREGGWHYYHYNEGEAPATEVELLKKYYELLEKDANSIKAKEIQIALQRQLSARAAVAARRPLNLFPSGREVDNSNTQFAAIALWVARRHQVPTDRALQIVAVYFRNTQFKDGTWPYVADGATRPKASLGMTCAGLICMALGRATLNEVDLVKNLATDPVILRGFVGVVQFMKTETVIPNENTYYSLWSLERVGMIYNLEKIGGVDWYKWAADHLVTTQSPGGSWGNGHYENVFGADTCFALLILKRANPAKDLAVKLKAPKGKVDLFAPIEKGTPEKSSRLRKGSDSIFISTATLDWPRGAMESTPRREQTEATRHVACDQRRIHFGVRPNAVISRA